MFLLYSTVVQQVAESIYTIELETKPHENAIPVGSSRQGHCVIL